jgi:hypothetical protein
LVKLGASIQRVAWARIPSKADWSSDNYSS